MFPDQASRRIPLFAPSAPSGEGASESAIFPALSHGGLHEVHAAQDSWAMAMAFALTAAKGRRGPVLLVRVARRNGKRMRPCGEGLAGLGLDPARLLLVDARDGAELLRAGHDAARCAGLAAVVLETTGHLPEYDLTASRRLVLAAERSRVPIAILRGDAPPRSSAAHTRWMIRAAPSAALIADAPGDAALEAELLRRRAGPSGMRWRLEWNDEDGAFRERRPDSIPADTAPPRNEALSGAVVPLASKRAGRAAAGRKRRAA